MGGISKTCSQTLPTFKQSDLSPTATITSEVGTSEETEVRTEGGKAKAKVAAKVKAKGRSQESFHFSREGI